MSRISAAVIGALLLALALGARFERRPPSIRDAHPVVSDTSSRNAHLRIDRLDCDASVYAQTNEGSGDEA